MTGPSIPKVSVIVPTRNRADFLPQLIRIFDSQTWSNKELLILDDSETADTNIEDIAKERDNIHYWHTNERPSIGGKRNLLCERSTGDLIAHFDDDDHYEPKYLERMVNLLEKEDSDLIKLAGWFCYHRPTQKLGYWDTTDQKSSHQIFGGTLAPEPKGEAFSETAHRSFLTGYGFSFLYKKSAWEETPFLDQDIGEDSTFTEQLLAKSKKVQLVMDQEGLCLHIIHAQNTSRCFPNYTLPGFSLKTYFPSHELSDTAARKKVQYQWGDDAPNVSICTLTHNRSQFLKLLQTCIEAQDYPLKKIEWVILDDSTNPGANTALATSTEVRIKHQRLPKKLKLGAKRNLAHRLCSGDILVYMDDDDYYPPSRISHAVDTLLKTGSGIAGSSILPIYFTHDQQLWVSGPFGQNHATAGTFAMTREFATSHFYDNEAECNEEKDFLREYTLPMAQLDPGQTMICISHHQNTFDKKKMRANGPTAKMRRLESDEAKIRKLLVPWQTLEGTKTTMTNNH